MSASERIPLSVGGGSGLASMAVHAPAGAGVSDHLQIPREALDTGKVPVTIVPDSSALAQHFAEKILGEYRDAKQRGRANVVMIVPVPPVGQYALLADRCNKERVSIADLVLIGMDEYLTDEGQWIEDSNPISFRGHIRRRLWDTLDPALAPPPEHRLTPHPDRLDEIPRLIEQYGGLDVCFAGVGVTGHIGFNEPPEPGETTDLEEFAALPTRVVTLAPETRTINAIQTWGGAINRIPRRGVTVGMREILGARKLRLFFNRPWHRATLREVLFGPVTPHCPASYAQRHPNAAAFITEDVTRAPVPNLA